MEAIGYFLIGGFLSGYLLWILYLATMNLIRAKQAGTLSRAAYALGLPVYLFGYALDIFLNFTVFSLLVWDVPRETTISKHLSRLIVTPGTAPWKLAICVFICAQLLDAFDPSGIHCQCKEEE